MVQFYEIVEDAVLLYAVIICKYKNKWVFCKHKNRITYECPGGHREVDEGIKDTAIRELWEETGALAYDLQPVCVYSVKNDEKETFGMLYAANVFEFGNLPPLEIEKIEFFEELPKEDEWTYPHIQPSLLKKAEEKYFKNLTKK